jgi:hypothetical protein
MQNMEFYVTSSKQWIANPDRVFGGWWKKNYIVVSGNEVRTHSDAVSESNYTAKDIAAKLYPEFFTGSYETRVFTGMA